YLTGEVDDDAPLRTVEQGEEWARWGSNPRPADYEVSARAGDAFWQLPLAMLALMKGQLSETD
ncbi:hypothetical protein C5B85_18180, partial [Pseudoclavibacter sp. AY1F1]|uniref:hypothetical protein n=1 Tax=Pseudoclavibacter sp. AY1F1 TaxID=2080583 RepID=UPI000D416DC8